MRDVPAHEPPIATSSATQNSAMLDSVAYLLSDRRVQFYFLILGMAIFRCVRLHRQHQRTHQHRTKSTPSSIAASSISATVSVILPLFLSALIVGITWFLILRFILTNLHSSASYFDDAYKDVLRSTSHYFTSSQLLTWAIVAVAWCAVERVDLCFIAFGFLGAMSASFVLWVPTRYRSRDSGRRERGVVVRNLPLSYAFTSALAFVSILRLRPCEPARRECAPDDGFGAFDVHFRGWLQCLHVALVLPVFLSYLPALLPARGGAAGAVPLREMDACLLFGAMAVVFATWHVRQVLREGAMYALPTTDCQRSIATDLACCALITLYAVYAEGKRGRKGVGQSNVGTALRTTCLAALAMPLVSPAAVLAGHLFLARCGDSHGLFVATLQRRMADRRRRSGEGRSAGARGGSATAKEVAAQRREKEETRDGTRGSEGGGKVATTRRVAWCNLGLWSPTTASDGAAAAAAAPSSSYDLACERLAHALGEAAGLAAADAVLSCGCGARDELTYYKATFGLRHITGLDPHLDPAREEEILGDGDHNVRLLRASVEDLAATPPSEPALFPPRRFDKILALDAAYHYPCRRAFLRDCFRLLPNSSDDAGHGGGGGEKVVALADLLLRGSRGADAPRWLRVALRAMGVPARNLWSAEEYRRHLVSLGYDDDVRVQLIGDDVFRGWHGYLPRCVLRHLDYALIVAKKPPAAAGRAPRKRKQVAIVGSGLAGLSAAQRLLAAPSAVDIDVDVYEAGDRPGLAGHTSLIGEQLVDGKPISSLPLLHSSRVGGYGLFILATRTLAC